MLLVQCWLALLAVTGNNTSRKPEALPLSVALKKLEHEFKAAQSAKDAPKKALHLYLLNDAADQYAESLNQNGISAPNGVYSIDPLSDTEPAVRAANLLRANIFECEYSGSWTDGPEGYEAYLSLSPNGPFAEEAWWRSRLRYRKISCYDGVGSEEETAGFVHDYSDFLRHFPQGKHAKQARDSLHEFEKELESYKHPESHR